METTVSIVTTASCHLLWVWLLLTGIYKPQRIEWQAMPLPRCEGIAVLRSLHSHESCWKTSTTKSCFTCLPWQTHENLFPAPPTLFSQILLLLGDAHQKFLEGHSHLIYKGNKRPQWHGQGHRSLLVQAWQQLLQFLPDWVTFLSTVCSVPTHEVSEWLGLLFPDHEDQVDWDPSGYDQAANAWQWGKKHDVCVDEKSTYLDEMQRYMIKHGWNTLNTRVFHWPVSTGLAYSALWPEIRKMPHRWLAHPNHTCGEGKKNHNKMLLLPLQHFRSFRFDESHSPGGATCNTSEKRDCAVPNREMAIKACNTKDQKRQGVSSNWTSQQNLICFRTLIGRGWSGFCQRNMIREAMESPMASQLTNAT